MPLLWRYLLYQFLKVFTLCAVAFVVILMTMRLDEIAHFATLGPEGFNILWFTLQQVPYILPIALPTSALISAILLVQGLSKSHELMAMRACGFSLRDILMPILSAALFLSALNFYIVSELSTTSHLNAGLIKTQLRSINPLIVLQSKHLMLTKGFYFDTLGPSKIGEMAQDIVLISRNTHHDRLNLMVAKKLQASPISFVGHQVSLLTSLKAKKDEFRENIMLENINEATTGLKDFSQMLANKIWILNNDHLSLPLLMAKLHNESQILKEVRLSVLSDNVKIKQSLQTCHRCYLEIIRRISIAISVFSFTLMGIAFGINISRNSSNRGIIYVVLLGAMFLIAFFGAKEADYNLILGSMLYILPHVIIIAASLWMLKRINHGLE
ncbi:MAG: LptF/LptG family permease [Parachlamydiaceae bacterium]|nr:LptF/LptG family permease [Parachlamydiaceae bacterium]